MYLESTACFGVFSDNGFHMRPDFPLEISFEGFNAVDLNAFKTGLTIRSAIKLQTSVVLYVRTCISF